MASGSKVDYAGRTVDLLLLKTILDVPVANRRMGIDVSNVSGEPMIVAGAEKMVQRYALCFINAMGSTKFRPRHGTNIVPRVGYGHVYDMPSLEVESAMADMLARMQVMEADEQEDTPDDERLVGTRITKLEFLREQAKVRIHVTLTNASGRTFMYIIPVAIGVH